MLICTLLGSISSLVPWASRTTLAVTYQLIFYLEAAVPVSSLGPQLTNRGWHERIRRDWGRFQIPCERRQRSLQARQCCRVE